MYYSGNWALCCAILVWKLPLRACLILKSGQIAPQLAQLPLFIRIFVILITIVQ